MAKKERFQTIRGFRYDKYNIREITGKNIVVYPSCDVGLNREGYWLLRMTPVGGVIVNWLMLK